MKKQMMTVLLGASLLGASAMLAKGKAARISNFSALRYEWRNGTVAPPYRYEYTVQLAPRGMGTRGEMVMRPGYAPSGPDTRPAWREVFAVSPTARKSLLATMRARGVFTRSWAEISGPNRPVGGGSENLQVKANGRTFRITSPVAGEAARADADAVFAAINALVPARARARLEAKRKKYEQQALRAQDGAG